MDFKYPYTDFHELNLDWFLAEFKKLTTEWLAMQEGWTDEQQAFQDLKDYVNSYFVNLDVQEEINNKLDGMAASGALAGIMQPYINANLPSVVANQLAPVVAAQLEPVVTSILPYVLASQLPAAVAGEAAAWLESHVDPDTGYVIDNTLTISTAAADAKIVGDKVKELQDQIDSIANEDSSYHILVWTPGSIYATDGTLNNNTIATHSRIEAYYKEADLIKISNPDMNEVYGFRYIYNNGVYTFVDVIALNVLSEYTCDPDSIYYWRFSAPTPIGSISNLTFKLIYNTKIVKDVKDLLTEVSTYGGKINTLEANSYVVFTESIYNPSTFTHEYLDWATGDPITFNDGRTSDFIEVQEGYIITYGLTVLGQISPVIACYDANYDYIQADSIQGTGSAGTWIYNTGVFVVPSGVKYIKFCSNRTSLTTDSITLGIPETLKQYVIDNVENPWRGKRCAAFGTSITDTSYFDTTFLQVTGKYLPILESISGMDCINYGIAGASFMTQIMNKVMTTSLADIDLVIIEGAVNDFATSKPLGNVGDTGNDTFAGTIYQMANYVYTNSTATLIFVTDHVGRYVHINPTPAGTDFYGDCAPSKQNMLGLLQIDYINMIAKQCEYFGIPCIMAGQEAGINLMTGNLYLMDHIHQSYVGGKQYALTIWEYLKNIKPRALNV